MIRFSSELDPNDGATMDISPARSATTARNQRRRPATQQPGYRDAVRAEPRPARRLHARPGRVLGGRAGSETPPGHWNTIAKRYRTARVRAPDRRRRSGGRPPRVGREALLRAERRRARRGGRGLGRGGDSDSVRPISMIRYMGSKRRRPTHLRPPPTRSRARRRRVRERKSADRARLAWKLADPATGPAAPADLVGERSVRTGWRRSSHRRSPGSCPDTARSAAPPPR